MFVVDSFSGEPFKGNPAAVCLVPFGTELSEASKQRIACEMRHSETAFVEELSSDETFDSAPHFNLQWFTPTCEVSMCGHGTLASAFVLFTQCKNCNKEISFSAKCGVLKTQFTPEFAVSMDFPLATVEEVKLETVSDILSVILTDSTQHLDLKFSPQTGKLLVRLQDDFPLESLQLDIPSLLKHKGVVRGVILTKKGSDQYDFYSRYFSPWNGIPEDPVTGSAHTVLAAYWHGVSGKGEFLARQCSRRGGDVRVKVLGNGRVSLSGEATLVLKGTILV